MRIAHVLRRLSFDDWGGTEQVVWNLAKAQKAAGHEVRLFATTALCSTPREVVDGLEIVRFRPIYPWWPMPRRVVEELDRKGGNPFVPGLGRALREWKPDVIHCHAMARIAELCLRVAGGKRGRTAKAVISLHGGGANVPGVEAASAWRRGERAWRGGGEPQGADARASALGQGDRLRYGLGPPHTGGLRRHRLRGRGRVREVQV